MATTEISITVHDASGSIQAVDSDSDIFASNIIGRDEQIALWNSIVDQPLIDWGLHPSYEDEDGLISPSSKAVGRAGELVKFMRQQSWSLPTGVVADGEGGIVFENKSDPVYRTFAIEKNGQITFCEYRDCKLLLHEPFSIPSLV